MNKTLTPIDAFSRFNTAIEREWNRADVQQRRKILEIWRCTANEEAYIAGIAHCDNGGSNSFSFNIIDYCELNADYYIQSAMLHNAQKRTHE